MDTSLIRMASHAGSWYLKNAEQLNTQLDQFLAQAQKSLNIKKVKAIIGPHAGFTYSGPTAAWGYQYLTPQENLRVFLLGPSHHAYFEGIALSKLEKYRTPIGDIELDQKTIQEISKSVSNQFLPKDAEEEEHSLEMHLPYIHKMLQGKPFKLVPIMVGVTDAKSEQAIGKALVKYFDDENTIFVISSDFCHWGARFRYQYYNKSDGQIHESIEKLDRRGAKLIEQHDTEGFQKYLSETKNTICGRRPIGILLNILRESSVKVKTELVRYAQSSQVVDEYDSSVSYASLVSYSE